MRQTVILSPHLDDAVFSCWHALNQPNAMVLTVFAGLPPIGTRTTWDRICGQPDGRQMVLDRRTENEAALSHTPATRKNLDFLDQQYRQQPLSAVDLAAAISQQIHPKSIVLAPLATSRLWRHPDHVLVRQAALLIAAQGFTVQFYADTPYLLLPSRTNSPALTRIVTRASRLCNTRLKPVIYSLNSEQQIAKSQAMARYRSQYKMTNLVSLGRLSQAASRSYELVMVPTD